MSGGRCTAWAESAVFDEALQYKHTSLLSLASAMAAASQRAVVGLPIPVTAALTFLLPCDGKPNKFPQTIRAERYAADGREQ